MPSRSIGYTVVREATFYGQRTETTSPTIITVVQQEYNHDILSLVSYLDDNTPNRYAIGTPVSVSWGLLGKRVEVFQGYVHHTEPIYTTAGSKAQRNLVKVVCVGATFLMKEKHRRVWSGRSITSVLCEIFNAYKLSANITPDTRVWETMVQSDETDWQFVCGLAQRNGWTVVPNNTDVTVAPRWVDLRAVRNSVSSFRATGADESIGGLGQVFTFQAVDGETTPDGGQKAARVAYGIDPAQGELFVAQQDVAPPQLGWISPTPFFTEYSTDVARSYGEAAIRLRGASEGARMYIQAKAEVMGDATVRPGKLVSLAGLGAKNDGLWYVQMAEHEVNQGTYLLHLTLGRDARWDNGFRPSTKRRRVLVTRTGAYGEPVGETPPTVLVAGMWRAAYAKPVTA